MLWALVEAACPSCWSPSEDQGAHAFLHPAWRSTRSGDNIAGKQRTTEGAERTHIYIYIYMCVCMYMYVCVSIYICIYRYTRLTLTGLSGTLHHNNHRARLLLAKSPGVTPSGHPCMIGPKGGRVWSQSARKVHAPAPAACLHPRKLGQTRRPDAQLPHAQPRGTQAAQRGPENPKP